MSIARANRWSGGPGFLVVLWTAGAALSCQFPDVHFGPDDAAIEGAASLGGNGLDDVISAGGTAATSAGGGAGVSASSGASAASSGTSGGGSGSEGDSGSSSAGTSSGSGTSGSASSGSTGGSSGGGGPSSGGSTGSTASGSTSGGSASGSTSGGSTSGATSGGSGSTSGSGGSSASSGGSSGGLNCQCTGSQTLYPTGVNCGTISIVGAGLLCTQAAGFTDSNVPCGQTNNTFVQCATVNSGPLGTLVCIASNPTTMTQQCH
jgi:hypothetical protein